MIIPEALLRVESSEHINRPVALEVDACGLMCPMPLLKAKQGLRNIQIGERIRVLATDAGSLKDFVSFAQLTYQLIEGFYFNESDGVYVYVICKQ